MQVLSVDPGEHGCGYALWIVQETKHSGEPRPRRTATLLDANYAPGLVFTRERGQHAVSPPKTWFDDTTIDELAIEIPQIYIQRTRGDQNDLVLLAFAAGAAFGALGVPRAVLYHPHDWKGNTPKDLGRDRYSIALAQHERDRLCFTKGARCKEERIHGLTADLEHNVWDAIGLGLHHLGRRARQ